MAPFGLSALSTLLRGPGAGRPAQAPPASWQRPIGQGWEAPYKVRYASNLDDGPNHGAPLGGFGAGCIGRGPDGNFNLWHLDGGEHWFGVLPDCQFALFEHDGTVSRARALAMTPERDDSRPEASKSPLGRWQWLGAETSDDNETSATAGTYSARYPLHWFDYQSDFRAEASCEAFSPILPGDYQRTSYPVAVFRWRLANPTKVPLDLSLLLSWRNTVGWFTNTDPSAAVTFRDDGSPEHNYLPAIGAGVGQRNRWIDTPGLTGVLLEGAPSQPIAEGEGQWCLAVPDQLEGVEVMRCSRWDPSGDGGEIWEAFSRDGSIPNSNNDRRSTGSEQASAAIALRLRLEPGAEIELPVVISWDLPVTAFATGTSALRRYTDFFGATGTSATAIAAEALGAWRQWRDAIEAWQKPVLERSDLPEPLRMALLNELYDLASGGSLWTAASSTDPVGRFGVLECLDYAWYESLDVRLYGSFALLQLWPELDKAVLRSFARAIPAADATPRPIGWYFTQGRGRVEAARKLAGATPHDLGAPNERPFDATNYTAYQDCNLWKDLASDFVLQVWRLFRLSPSGEDLRFLADCWPAVVESLRYLKQFDINDDGLPDNGGAPDQTFDDWPLQGVSAYCGALWIAALEAALAMAQRLQLDLGLDTGAEQREFGSWLEPSRANFDRLLWNGEYYRIDASSGTPVVMADQLCGDFYARLLGLPPVVSDERALSALTAIREACFERFEGGRLGVANGLRRDGTPLDPNGTHPLEIWTGINFGLAAYYRLMGQTDTAMAISGAVVGQVYAGGLQFRTPEAITAVGTFRACHYLRAMAIWALWATHTQWQPIPGAEREP
ncbi:bile acid beta-glucosidase [Synechococcus sp. Cruz-9H2]|uniref:GH116 family glycosyl hydrolase n=1 Tax=unclassified Synechococcus TaxID=2626047 RepID=UPI0020CE1F73|nr:MULTISPECIES: GH116 family glycosyl hydrolase [unclassified Synechococcus]MCP9819220.1 bile acid beta-glucosidase [Synechococcus sp. Cruz-9H2]MCP9843724.1 bile acid beta-glucosidase [Synechococcus sp. Edmonson 11F2]MCP9855557.1 bile acid beta-glucosidase [Synechococcus sp. Cruz-9C9]MCP9862995.1 bile acid beta-glucosidase [Synechococcus sp. Cruz-7E5]MCP9870130.1 bile acid beta-glucosidase [Synechococcus sp. Cruz-7B9]